MKIKKTEYRVILKQSSDGLIADINKFLEEGWECMGGVSISYNNSGLLTYDQAIIKTK